IRSKRHRHDRWRSRRGAAAEDPAQRPATGRPRGAEAVGKYLVIIEEGSTSFGAYVPDLPGCVAAGSTREEVMELIREAVALHIDDMRRTGQPVPKPSSAPVFVDAEAA